jgi:hypothetical protein
MVWYGFWKWLIWIGVAQLASNMSQVSMYGINGMVFGWLSCSKKLNGVEDGSDVQ